jgi:hypothetical protein
VVSARLRKKPSLSSRETRHKGFFCGLLLLTSLAAGCATAGPDPTLAWPDGPLHDPITEWGGRRAERDSSGGVVGVAVTSVPVRCENPSGCDELGPLRARELAQIARVQPLVRAAARAHDVPVDLINAMIWVESHFETQAVSPTGALGLMQLMPGTGREVARDLGRRYLPYDPDFNIHAGTYYVAQMLQRFDWDLRLALAAYNAGPYAVEAFTRNQQPLPEESRQYVSRVLVAARAFRSLIR